MKVLGGVLALAVVIALAGCATGSYLLTSDVSPDSIPAFLAEPQGHEDIVTGIDVSVLGGLDPESTRYQGERGGLQIFLAVQGDNTVYFVTGQLGNRSSWGSGGSVGNSVIGFQPIPGGEKFQYLPHGTADADLPAGWTALSAWVAVSN